MLPRDMVDTLHKGDTDDDDDNNNNNKMLLLLLNKLSCHSVAVVLTLVPPRKNAICNTDN